MDKDLEVMMNALRETSDLMPPVTQPAVYAVAGVTMLGLPLDEWVLIGTGVLVVLNIGLAVYKWINIWRGK